jgi:hypothetical protein
MSIQNRVEREASGFGMPWESIYGQLVEISFTAVVSG